MSVHVLPASPGWLPSLTPEQLREFIAHAAGALAYQTDERLCAWVLRRLADELDPAPSNEA